MMDHLGQYLYCVIRCPEDRVFEGATPIGGGAGGPVRALSHGGLAVVVSDSPVTEYTSTRANMLAHQRVQERVMRECPLLPVRFGTVANSALPQQDLRRLLEKRSQEFQGLLADMEGKVELGLKVLWRDEQTVFAEILATHPELRRFRDTLIGKPPQATHFERARLGERIKEALDRKRAGEAASLLAPLRGIVCRTVENPTVVDRMICNAAFLVDKEREEELDHAVSRLDEVWGHRVLLKYVGPLPPYNFVNIVVNWEEL
jgi:hypothetical protein